MNKAEKRLIVLTEKDLSDFCQAEKRSGRVPLEIDFILVELPE
jgi:hypothetical protein